MKIKVISDCHLEFLGNEFMDFLVPNDGADVLVLSGDIITADKAKKFLPWFEDICDRFTNVIQVLGNHEHYHGELDTSYDQLKETFGHITNLHILENETREIDGVLFIGQTLWTDCNKGDPITKSSLQYYMNDYRLIRMAKQGYRKTNPQDMLNIHYKSIDYIKKVLDEKKYDKVVVVGHHAPTPLSISPEFKDDHLINGGYVSDLSELILDHPEIKYWFHGHLHSASDYMMGETRVICNPVGYPGQDTGFYGNMIIEV